MNEVGIDIRCMSKCLRNCFVNSRSTCELSVNFRAGENYKLITLHSLMTPEQQHEAFERPPKGTRKARGENDLMIFFTTV